MAGDQVQVVKDGDRRLGQSGTVVHIATQGAKVRFSDGQEEGFKCSSLLPARAPQTAAQPLPPQRSQSAGAPPPPPPVRRTQSAPAQTSWEEELVQLDVRVQRLASSSRTPQLVQAARQHSNPKGTTRNASALARARAAAARRQPKAKQGGPKERLNTLRDEAEGMARGIRIDATAPIKRYYHCATTMLDQGRKHAAARDWERAYVLLMRFVTFFLERMPEHPDFKGKSTATQHRSLKNDIKVRLPPLTPEGRLGTHHVTTRSR